MNRRVWTGVIAGVLASLLLLGVATTAYEVGQRHEVVTSTVGNGEAVRVVGDGWGAGYGHGGGFFFLFPLLILFLLFLAFRGRRGWYGGGPGRYWAGYGGPCGPPSFEEQNRRAHGEPAARPGPTDAAEA